MCNFEPRPYQVGRYYDVQCVHGRLHDDIGWWPVMGEAHRDSEIVNFTYLHYHVDWRFVSKERFHRLVERAHRGPAVEAHAVPLMLFPERGYGVRRFDDDPSAVARESRRLLCKRQLPQYPHAAAPWQGALAQHHAADCLRRGVCPHRGYDLSREPVTDGVVTCPLHGLRWNVATGAAVLPSDSTAQQAV